MQQLEVAVPPSEGTQIRLRLKPRCNHYLPACSGEVQVDNANSVSGVVVIMPQPRHTQHAALQMEGHGQGGGLGWAAAGEGLEGSQGLEEGLGWAAAAGIGHEQGQGGGLGWAAAWEGHEQGQGVGLGWAAAGQGQEQGQAGGLGWAASGGAGLGCSAAGSGQQGAGLGSVGNANEPWEQLQKQMAANSLHGSYGPHGTTTLPEDPGSGSDSEGEVILFKGRPKGPGLGGAGQGAGPGTGQGAGMGSGQHPPALMEGTRQHVHKQEQQGQSRDEGDSELQEQESHMGLGYVNKWVHCHIWYQPSSFCFVRACTPAHF